MASILLFALGLASALITGVSAQSDSDISNPDVKVWAAVAFINHGETTPAISRLQTVLTPDGAQQMLRQGQAFRHRYVGNNSKSNNTTTAPIQNIAADAIDNKQLRILSDTHEWIVGGATAFLQGLYPPTTDAFVNAAGGKDMSNDFTAGSNTTNYPLNGYQYPNIETLSLMNNISVSINGISRCTTWEAEKNDSLKNRADIVKQADDSKDFYSTLFTTEPLKGSLPVAEANFWQAYDVYDFVRYMYKHNETVFTGLKDSANTTLDTLQENAFAWESAQNSDSNTTTDDKMNILYSIAGRTLAAEIADQISGFVNSSDTSPKLGLMFGSIQPLLAFFEIAGLQTQENVDSGPFGRIPEPGAAMVFELVGEQPDSTSIPDPQDLRIRFYYRASAEADEQFSKYSLFGSGFGGPSFAYTGFIRQMQFLGKSPEDWCSICKPAQDAPWCVGDSSSKSSSGPVSPAIGGVIGSIVTLGVVGLVSLGLFLLGGFRIQRSGDRDRNGGPRGFKGPEKMASDTDVNVTRSGGRDERIGSWEMRDGGDAEPALLGPVGIVTSHFHREGQTDDEMSVSGDRPAKVHEGF